MFVLTTMPETDREYFLFAERIAAKSWRTTEVMR